MDGSAQVLVSGDPEVVQVFSEDPQLVVVVRDDLAYSVTVLPDPEPQIVQVVVPEILEPQVIEVHAEGPAGPAGPQGEMGPQGPAGSGTSFELTQGFATPSTLWVIDHGFGTYGVEVICVDQNGELIEGNVRYPSENRVEVDWFYPTAGTARLFR